MSDKPPFRISPPLAALGIFVIVAIGFVIWFAFQKAPPELEISEQTTVVVAPLDERGRIDYETPWNTTLREGVTPETNALIPLTRVIGPRPEGGRGMPADWWKLVGADEPPEEGEYLKDSTVKFFHDQLEADDNGMPQNRRQALEEEETRLRIEPWTTKDSPHFVEWLKANDKPLSLVASAVKLPHYYHPIIARTTDGQKQDLICALLPYAQKMRAIANILSIRAMWHLGEGRADDAWADLMTIHHLGGLMMQNSNTLIEYLVGVALRSIAMARMVKVIEVVKPELAQLRRWKNEFQERPVNPKWETMIGVYERYMGLDSLLSIKAAQVKGHKAFDGWFANDKEVEAILRHRGAIDWNDVLTTYNEYYDQLTRHTVQLTKPGASHEQREAARAAIVEMERSLGPSSPDNSSQSMSVTIIRLFLPAIQKVANAGLRIEQNTTFVKLLFDLEEHRLKHNSYPERVDQFNAPRDVFTGEPIRYKRLPNGYYLHSLGANKSDDFKEQLDSTTTGDDVVVKVMRK